jgi:hypothetical protein
MGPHLIVYAIIALVAGGFLFGIRQQGYNAAKRECAAAAAAAKAAANKVDLEAGVDAADQMMGAIAEARARAQVARENIEKVKDDAKTRPDSGCFATDADVRGVRDRAERSSR